MVAQAAASDFHVLGAGNGDFLVAEIAREHVNANCIRCGVALTGRPTGRGVVDAGCEVLFKLKGSK